jgi:uncharacterized cupin superfamily protein
VSDPTITFALDLTLDYEPVSTEQVVDGSPQTGLWEAKSGEWGVWEMTPGAMRDVEVDEFFVVVAGEATLERHVESVSGTTELRPGVVCRLFEGEETVWRVRSALRKVYWVPRS